MERETINRVRAGRIARNWTQDELARRSGVSRAGISAIEVGRLVPSVTAALGIAAALECRVEDLFSAASDDPPVAVWAAPPLRDPLRYWRAEVGGREILFPAERSPLGICPTDGRFCAGEFQEHPQAAPRDRLVIACCDPAVALLAQHLSQTSGVRLVALQRSSGEALNLLRQGLVHVAGLHLAPSDAPDGNRDLVRQRLGPGYTLLHVAHWDEGVALPPHLALPSLEAVRASRLRWIGREPGSAARQRLDDLLQDRKTPRRIAYDHRGVAEAIRCGWADAGVCHRMVSDEAGLNFVTLQRERYDLCWPQTFTGDPRLLALLHATRSRAYRAHLDQLPGIDARECGALSTSV